MVFLCKILKTDRKIREGKGNFQKKGEWKLLKVEIKIIWIVRTNATLFPRMPLTKLQNKKDPHLLLENVCPPNGHWQV